LNQLANLQITIDSINGYDARVYDLSGRLINEVSEKKYLYQQLPTGKFNLLNNFLGSVKSVLVYQNKQSLPISTPLGAINDNNVIIFYKFDSKYFGSDK
jgi:hypothetical protein